jgi:hypothetical protein
MKIGSVTAQVLRALLSPVWLLAYGQLCQIPAIRKYVNELFVLPIDTLNHTSSTAMAYPTHGLLTQAMKLPYILLHPLHTTPRSSKTDNYTSATKAQHTTYWEIKLNNDA